MRAMLSTRPEMSRLVAASSWVRRRFADHLRHRTDALVDALQGLAGPAPRQIEAGVDLTVARFRVIRSGPQLILSI
jgi:hypothetical protein